MGKTMAENTNFYTAEESLLGLPTIITNNSPCGLRDFVQNESGWCELRRIEGKVTSVPLTDGSNQSSKIMTAYHKRADSFLRQPCQSFIAGLKSGKFSAGETTQVPGELRREVLRSHECGFLDVQLVKDGGLLHNPNGFLVKRCSRKIGKY
jgi:hypothetical protein